MPERCGVAASHSLGKDNSAHPFATPHLVTSLWHLESGRERTRITEINKCQMMRHFQTLILSECGFSVFHLGLPPNTTVQSPMVSEEIIQDNAIKNGGSFLVGLGFKLRAPCIAKQVVYYLNNYSMYFGPVILGMEPHSLFAQDCLEL
jgi:hypothetical protein